MKCARNIGKVNRLFALHSPILVSFLTTIVLHIGWINKKGETRLVDCVGQFASSGRKSARGENVRPTPAVFQVQAREWFPLSPLVYNGLVSTRS